MITLNKISQFEVSEPQWDPGGYRCHLAISKESDGTFSAVVLNLPGAGSCGDSIDEAIAHANEAVIAVIESFKDDDAEIPWRDLTEYDVPDDAIQKWILVNA